MFGEPVPFVRVGLGRSVSVRVRPCRPRARFGGFVSPLLPWVLLSSFWALNLFAASSSPEKQTNEESWWSLKPLKKSAVPTVPAGEYKTCPRPPIYHFFLAKLVGGAFPPPPPADKRTLLRRVYFD